MVRASSREGAGQRQVAAAVRPASRNRPQRLPEVQEHNGSTMVDDEMKPTRRTEQAKREASRARILQYIADAIISGPDAVYIDRWLVSNGADQESNANGTSRVGTIIMTVHVENERDLMGRLEVVDFDRAQVGLVREKVSAGSRRTQFEYAEQWPDWSEATERADEALLNQAPKTAGRERRTPTPAVEKTSIQHRVLCYVKRALETDAHWTAMDGWLAEKAAQDAALGHGHTGELEASR